MSVRLSLLLIAIVLFTAGPARAGGDEVRGAKIFKVVCAACHGQDGKGRDAPSLINCPICESEQALVDKITKDMPKGRPSACAAPCAADAAAYILNKLNR